MTRLANSAVVITFLMLVSLMPFAAQAKVDWEVSGAVQLDETPIDVAQTQGGEFTFLLTDQAKVIIYSTDGSVVGTVPVDPSVTDIAVSANGEQLYLINSKRKTLQTVTINFSVEINVADSPFLGPAGAGVLLAVFSDFQ
jgi:DNA-binding beta-propeller fold protein YncE